MSKQSVIVVGGGIAGIAASLRLAEAGVAVSLLETRKKLGGRATSFQDVRSGRMLDNCQHVTLGCCTNYLDLLSRLGAEDQITWHREQYWVEAGGRVSTITSGGLGSILPAPMHFGPSLLGARFLSLADISSLGRAVRMIMRTDRSLWCDRTFTEFLRAAGQSDRLIRRFWAPVVVSACNLDCHRVAAAAALHVFQEGFIGHRRAAEIGVPRVPLLDLYDKAEQAIAAAGGTLTLGCGVQRLDARTVTTSAGQTLTADRVICALPVERAAETIDPALRASDPRLPRLDEFQFSPILGVHLTFDVPVLHFPHAVLVERDTQWLFRKDDAGCSLHAVISAADSWLDLSEDEIARRVRADIDACFPAAAAAKLLSVRAVKEKRATFAATPAVEHLRPQAALPGDDRCLILAGDYTATGWPATMEGATRSGYTAAACILGQSRSSALVPDLPIAPLARLLGLKHQPA